MIKIIVQKELVSPSVLKIFKVILKAIYGKGKKNAKSLIFLFSFDMLHTRTKFSQIFVLSAIIKADPLTEPFSFLFIFEETFQQLMFYLKKAFFDIFSLDVEVLFKKQIKIALVLRR